MQTPHATTHSSDVWLAWLAWHSMHRSIMWFRQMAQLSTTISCHQKKKEEGGKTVRSFARLVSYTYKKHVHWQQYHGRTITHTGWRTWIERQRRIPHLFFWKDRKKKRHGECRRQFLCICRHDADTAVLPLARLHRISPAD